MLQESGSHCRSRRLPSRAFLGTVSDAGAAPESHVGPTAGQEYAPGIAVQTRTPLSDFGSHLGSSVRSG